jgi:hypothetical protein
MSTHRNKIDTELLAVLDDTFCDILFCNVVYVLVHQYLTWEVLADLLQVGRSFLLSG